MKRIQPERFVGAVFGAWTVKALAGRSPRGDQLVDAICRCGTERAHHLNELRRGKSKSCGCLKAYNVSASRRGASFVAGQLPADVDAVVFDLDGVTIRAGDVARFRALFSEADQDACWPWRGEPNRGGYGRIAIDGRHVMANRLALSLHLGRAVPEGVVARHCLGEIEPSVTPAQASALYRIRDQRGREHWVNAERTREALFEIRARASFLPLRTLDGGKTWRLADATFGSEGA